MSPVNTSLAASGLWRNDPSRASRARGWGPWLELPPPTPSLMQGQGAPCFRGHSLTF